MTCDRCGKDRMLNEVHAPQRQRNMSLTRPQTAR
jgi:hypothetical protein